jgi:ABC-2 type transport system permease protein
MKIVFGFVRTAFHDAAIYRIDFWFSLLSVFFMMYASYSIWYILYQQSPNAFGVDLEQMTTYGVLGMLLSPILGATMRTRNYIATQVRTGSLEIDLMKPLDFMLHMLARNIGEVAVQVVTRGLPGLLFAYLVLGIRVPSSAGAVLAFVVSLVLGYLVYFGVNFMIGMLSIVTADVRTYTWAYNSLIRFTSGEVIPLWLFPPLLGTIMAALPFSAIYFVPMSIFVGAYPGDLAGALLLQIFWAVAILLMCRLIWLKFQRRVTVRGG